IDLRGCSATNQQKENDKPDRFHLAEISMIRESAFKESLSFSVQPVTNAPAHLHFADLPDVRRIGERRGGAFSGTNAEENLRHTNSDAAPEEEDRYCREKEIADAEPNGKANSFANSHGKEILGAPGATIPSAIGIAV